MIVTNSLLDGGSSIGSSTEEYEIFVPRPDDASVNEDDWGVVSMYESEHVDPGELILEGEETLHLLIDDEDKIHARHEDPQLSLLGSDSVPTIVGSIDGLHAEEATDKAMLEAPAVEEAYQNEKVVAFHAGVQTTSFEPQIAQKSRFILLLAPALLLIPTIASVCLYHERNSLQMSIVELEDVISSLHVEAERRKLDEELLWESNEYLQLSSEELQGKVASLKREAERKEKMDQLQLDAFQKERSNLKLYVLHLQDLVASLTKKAAKEKRQGDILYQDKQFLEWSASSLQEKLKALKEEAERSLLEEKLRLEALHNEKSSLAKLVENAQSEVARVKRETDKKLREEGLRWNALFQEKISLRVSTARLEEQVFKLKKTAEQRRRQEDLRRGELQKERDALTVTVGTLAGEVSALKQEAAKRQQTQDFLPWNTCGAKSGDIILADNCWLNAKANIQLGGCASDARDVINHALYNFSAAVSHWMTSYSSPEASQGYSNNSTAASATKTHRKVDYLRKAPWNSTTTKNTMWNVTSADLGAGDYGESVAKMIRKVDSFGRALWNATAFKMYRNGNNTQYSQERSFFSRMDLNGKLWFESFFSQSPSRKARRSSKHLGGLDRVFQKVSDIIHAASSPDHFLEEASALFHSISKSSSCVPGDALRAPAHKKFCLGLPFNQTSKKYLMKVSTNAFEEISLAHSATM